ncbi:MAG: hypothetical protein V4501_07550 [Pseudomonadota bacterium]
MTTLAALFQALDNKDFNQANALIGSDVTLLAQRNAEQITVLEYYAGKANLVVTEWLCKKLTSLDMSVDIYDDFSNCALIQTAYANNSDEIVKILLKYTTLPNLRQWLVQRQLIAILGTNFLLQNNIKVSQQQASSAEAGYTIESTQILCSAITQLLKTSSQYAEIEEAVVNYYQNTWSTDNSNKLTVSLIRRANQQNRPRVLFNAGCVGHTFAVSIQRQETGSYQLSFYDSNRPDSMLNFSNMARAYVNSEIAIVSRINVSADQLIDIVLKLLINKNKSEKEVSEWLASLPEKLNNPYQYEQNILVNTDTQEDSRCYWENPKYAVLDLFIDKFGVETGILEFNNFLVSINKKALENFKSEFKNQYDTGAVDRLESALSNTRSFQLPAAYAVKFVVSMLTITTGAALTIFSLYALQGVASFTFIATLLGGPVGLIAAATVGALLMLHEWVLPAVTNLITITMAFFKGSLEAEKSLLINEDNKKVFTTSTEQLNSPLLASTKPEAEPVAINTELAKTNKYSFSNISRFFKNKKAKTNSPAAAKHTFFSSKKTAALMVKDDLNNLWKIPSNVAAR